MPPSPPQPPACAECQTSTQYAQGGAPQQSASRMTRSSDGKMRIDTGTTSVITDPHTQQAMVLDHVQKTATILPMRPTPPQLAVPKPGAPTPPFQPPSTPSVGVQDLGKSVIDGHPVDGKRYIVQPPQAPQAPQMAPPPAAPGAPQAPQAPQMPQKPPMPTVADVWTSTSLGMPVLTRVSGPFGEQTSYCKPAASGEPHPALFQIPPGYKPVMPPPAPPK
jgi:hypothetical protein